MRIAYTVALSSLAAPGCGDEAGIIIEVTRDERVTAPEVLEFHIGVSQEVSVTISAVPQCGGGADGTRWFVEASTVEAEREARLDGKDIAGEPYRLLLRPGEVEPDASLMVVVVGRRGGDVVGLGQLGDPASFVSGKAVRWQVVLQPPGDDVTVRNGCACGPAGAIVTAGDPDCDRATGDDDCQPENGTVYPGADERCDGVDNDCNPNTVFDDTLDCYVTTENGCFYGQRQCDDLAGDDDEGGRLGACQTTGGLTDQVPVDLCERFNQCDPSTSQFECANQGITRTARCELLVTESGGLCPLRSVVLEPSKDVGDGACRWSVLGGIEQAHLDAYLMPDPPEPVRLAAIDQCEPLFRFATRVGGEEVPADRVLVFFQLLGQPGGELVDIEVKSERVSVCPLEQPGLVCDGLRTSPVDLPDTLP